MVTGLTHVALMVSDMEKSLKFYRDALGLPHIFSIKDQDGNPWIEYIKVRDYQFIELFYAKEGYSSQNGSFMHICLQVDDCFATAKAIEESGYELWRQPKMGPDGNYQCWVKDPDGHQIEIMQILPGTEQAKASEKE